MCLKIFILFKMCLDLFQNFLRGSGALPGGPGGPGGPQNGQKYQNYEVLEIGPSSPNETS